MNCLECEYHEIVADPDPHDWFCDDDVAVVCSKVKNPNKDENSIYNASRNSFRIITCACRPYNIKKESKTPKWCPTKKGFTIVELLTVMAVMAVLIGLIIPAITVINQKEENIPAHKIEARETLTVVDGKVMGGIGKSYKIELCPSFSVASGKPPKMFIKGFNEGKFIKVKSHYYILWDPKEQTQIEIIAITMSNNFKDEVKILVEAY